MFGILARKWWVLALRGLIAVTFGFLALAWPAITLPVLITLFGAFAITTGVLNTFAGMAALGSNGRWWGTLLAGITGLLIGPLTLANPSMNAVALLSLAAVYILLSGLFDLLAAAQLERPKDIEWLLAFSGVLSLLFGAYLIAFPGEGALAWANVIALYAVLHGILSLVLAFHVRGLVHDVREPRDISHPRTRRPSRPGLS